MTMMTRGFHTWDLAEDHIAVWTSSSGYTSRQLQVQLVATNPDSDIEDGSCA